MDGGLMITVNQGGIALLSAQFLTTTSSPINVSDATVEVIGTGGAVVLGPIAMLGPVITGFYYYDWNVPNSISTGNYVIRYSGTVLGVPTAITDELFIQPAGSPIISMTPRQIELVAKLETYIKCAQRIPVINEVPRRSADFTQYQLSWPRWNLTNPIVKRNNEIITSGYVIDYDTGVITFDQPQHRSDVFHVTYNFRWFTPEDELNFLADALNQINLEAPGTTFGLNNVPDQYMGVLMLGATKNAIKQLLFCLLFQQPQTVFGGPERANQVQQDLRALKDNNEKEFERDKKLIKRAQYPRIGLIVTPEYTMPGGRSRWFRYLYSSGI